MYNFTKITEDFFQMAFIDIPAEGVDVKNKRLTNRRNFPWGWRSLFRLWWRGPTTFSHPRRTFSLGRRTTAARTDAT